MVKTIGRISFNRDDKIGQGRDGTVVFRYSTYDFFAFCKISAMHLYFVTIRPKTDRYIYDRFLKYLL